MPLASLTAYVRVVRQGQQLEPEARRYVELLHARPQRPEPAALVPLLDCPLFRERPVGGARRDERDEVAVLWTDEVPGRQEDVRPRHGDEERLRVEVAWQAATVALEAEPVVPLFFPAALGVRLGDDLRRVRDWGPVGIGGRPGLRQLGARSQLLHSRSRRLILHVWRARVRLMQETRRSVTVGLMTRLRGRVLM